MALIKCPDCGTEVSDRARTCPKCGYPIDEYVAELAEKEEERKEQEVIQKIKESKDYKSLSKISTFIIYDHTLSLTGDHVRNVKVDSLIDIGFRESRRRALEIIAPNNAPEFDPDMVFVGKNHDYVYGLMLDWIRTVIEPIARNYASGYRAYIDNEDESVDTFILDNLEVTHFWETIYEPAYHILERTLSDLSVCFLNIQSAQYDLDSADGDFITGVRANSIAGLINASITKELTNWVSRGVYKGFKGYNKKYNQAVEEYYKTEYKGIVDFFDLVYNKLFLLAIEACEALKKDMVENYYLLTPELYIPKIKIPSPKLREIKGKKKKIEELVKSLQGVAACYSLTYVGALVNISSSESEILELQKLWNLYDVDKNVKKILIDDDVRADVLVDADKVDEIINTPGEDISREQETFIEECNARYDNYKHACNVLKIKISKEATKDMDSMRSKLLTADGKKFSSKQEKREYLEEKQKYDALYKKVKDIQPEDDIKGNINALKEYIELGDPKFESIKETYKKNIEKASKKIEITTKHREAKIVKEFLGKLIKIPSNSFVKEDSSDWKNRWDLFSLIDGLEKGDPVVYYKDSKKAIVFTMYGFYVFEENILQDIVFLSDIKRAQIINDKEVVVSSDYNSLHLVGFTWYKPSEKCFLLFQEYAEKARQELNNCPDSENGAAIERRKIEQAKINDFKTSVSNVIEELKYTPGKEGVLVNKILEAFQNNDLKGFYIYPSEEFFNVSFQAKALLEENEYPIVIFEGDRLFCLTNKSLIYGNPAKHESISYDRLYGIYLEPVKKRIDFSYDYSTDGTMYIHYLGYDWFYDKEENYDNLPKLGKILSGIFNLKFNDGTDEILKTEHRRRVNEILESKDSNEEKYQKIRDDTIQFGLINKEGKIIEYSFEKQFIFDYKGYVMPILADLRVSSIYGDLRDYKSKSIEEINQLIEGVKNIYLDHDILKWNDNRLELNRYYHFDVREKNTFHGSVRDTWNHLLEEQKRLQSIEDLKGMFGGLFKRGKTNKNNKELQNTQKAAAIQTEDKKPQTNYGMQETERPVSVSEFKFCVFCGNKIKRVSKFCAFCGKPNK